MRRREFVTVLSSVAVVCPLAARAQHASLPVVGFMSSRSPDESTPHVAAFRQGLTEMGYVEGRNVAIEYLWAKGRYGAVAGISS